MATWRPPAPADDGRPAGLAAMPPALAAFWTERHLCLLTTLLPGREPHVVPVGVALDPEQDCAWIITRDGSQKVRNLERDDLLAVGQVDRGQWATIHGRAEVRRDAASVARACERYASRYRQPRPNPERVALRVVVDRVVASAALLEEQPGG